MTINLAELDQVVAKMRALGVRRLRSEDLEIDLADEPDPLENEPGPATKQEGDDGPGWEPDDAKRRPTLKKFDDGK